MMNIKLLAIAFLSLLPFSSFGCDVLDNIPGGFKYDESEKYKWIEYCPDNTCEVVRVKRGVSSEKLRFIFSGYILFGSKYIYLDEWRRNVNYSEIAKCFPEKIIPQECKSYQGRDFIKCGISKTINDVDARGFFVRFDEGSTSRVNIDLINEVN